MLRAQKNLEGYEPVCENCSATGSLEKFFSTSVSQTFVALTLENNFKEGDFLFFMVSVIVFYSCKLC